MKVGLKILKVECNVRTLNDGATMLWSSFDTLNETAHYRILIIQLCYFSLLYFLFPFVVLTIVILREAKLTQLHISHEC